jgi:hypothetical protein
MPLSSLIESIMHNHVTQPPLALLNTLDTAIDEVELATHRHERAQ